jgi:hypothetical protein
MVIWLYVKHKKRKMVSKHTLGLVDWMLAIDYDISKLPKSLHEVLAGVKNVPDLPSSTALTV